MKRRCSECEKIKKARNDLGYCERAINGKRPIKVLSGKQQITDEFEKRGLTMEGNYNG